MHDASPSAELVVASAMLAVGIAFGLAYFRALRWTIRRRGTHTLVIHVVASLVRLLGAALLFGAAARLGALPLLAAFAGFLLARAISMRAVRKAD